MLWHKPPQVPLNAAVAKFDAPRTNVSAITDMGSKLEWLVAKQF